MAARKTKSLTEAWREKIQTSMLINRLEAHVEGKVELSSTQVTAALGLLKKTAPDLASVAVGGDHDGAPISIDGLRELLGAKLDRIADIEPATKPQNLLN